jgi:hypothetical protein
MLPERWFGRARGRLNLLLSRQRLKEMSDYMMDCILRYELKENYPEDTKEEFEMPQPSKNIGLYILWAVVFLAASTLAILSILRYKKIISY